MTTPDGADNDVYIRPVSDEDIDVLFEHQRDPEAVAMAAFPARDRQAFLTHWAKTRADPTVIKYTIVASGQVAGNIASWEREGQRLIGYWVGRDVWGRGIATRALELFLVRVPSRPLYAEVVVHNAGSIRVLEKCGFLRSVDSHIPHADIGGGFDDVEEILFVLGE